MRRLNGVMLGMVLTLCLFVPVQASLIGDDVSLQIILTNSSINFDDTGSTTVLANADDLFRVGSSVITFEVDPFLSGVDITLSRCAATLCRSIGIGQGSKIVFSDLDWVGGPSGKVIGANVTENLTLFNASTSFTDDSATVSFLDNGSASTWALGQTLTINLDVEHNPVPTPSASLLMGTGLLGLIGYRKWSNKHN